MSLANDSMVELDDRDEAVLEVLAEGRANPYLIRDETGLEKGDVNTVLNRLGRSGHIEQVTRGLYEITEKGRKAIGNGSADAVIEGLKQDVGEFVVEAEHFGEDRLRVVGKKRGAPLYPESILEYLTLSGWYAERTDFETINGTEYPVVEFIRGIEVEKLIQREKSRFETLDLQSKRERFKP